MTWFKVALFAFIFSMVMVPLRVAFPQVDLRGAMLSLAIFDLLNESIYSGETEVRSVANKACFMTPYAILLFLGSGTFHRLLEQLLS